MTTITRRPLAVPIELLQDQRLGHAAVRVACALWWLSSEVDGRLMCLASIPDIGRACGMTRRAVEAQLQQQTDRRGTLAAEGWVSAGEPCGYVLGTTTMGVRYYHEQATNSHHGSLPPWEYPTTTMGVPYYHHGSRASGGGRGGCSSGSSNSTKSTGPTTAPGMTARGGQRRASHERREADERTQGLVTGGRRPTAAAGPAAHPEVGDGAGPAADRALDRRQAPQASQGGVERQRTPGVGSDVEWHGRCPGAPREDAGERRPDADRNLSIAGQTGRGDGAPHDPRSQAGRAPAAEAASSDGAPWPSQRQGPGSDGGRPRHQAASNLTATDPHRASDGTQPEVPRREQAGEDVRGRRAEPAEALALTHPTTERKPWKRTRTFDPDHVERSVLEAAMRTLHEWRALAGWPAKGWNADSAGHGEALLRCLRGSEQLSVGAVLDGIKATVWADSTRDPSRGPEAAKLASGAHANLNRIFGPTKAGKRERCVEEWIEAGRPEPRNRNAKPGAPRAIEVDGKALTGRELVIYQAAGVDALGRRDVRAYREATAAKASAGYESEVVLW